MKFNISQRVMLLAGASIILTALALFLLSFLGISMLHGALDDWQIEVKNSVTKNTSAMAQEESEKRLINMAKVKAYTMNLALEYKMADAQNLALKITNILTHAENYLPRTLPNPKDRKIFCEEVYVFFTPGLQIDEKTANEANLAANIAEDLSALVQRARGTQAAFYIGSKNGYLIAAGSKFDDEEFLNITQEFLESYDPRTRPWYIAAKNANDVTFTDYYLAVEGYPMITVAAPYYDSNGFAGVVGIDASLNSFQQQMQDAALGATNFNFALDKNGNILFSSRNYGELSATLEQKDLRESAEKTVAEAAKKMTAGESGTMPVKIDGEEYYLAFAPIPKVGWSFGTLIAAQEVQKPFADIQQKLSTQIQNFSQKLIPLLDEIQIKTYPILGALIIFMLAFGYWTSRKFLKPIMKLSAGVNEIAQGNLDKKIDIHTNDEIEHLATCFNAMTDAIQEQMKNLSAITAEKERISTELNVATYIQEGMLPKNFPASICKNRFALNATMHHAKEVGGDFYDFYFVDENNLVITIADVSGKGVPAALFMVIAKTILKNNFLTGAPDDLAGIVERANNQLCEGNKAGMFVTAFIAQIDLTTGKIIFVNAGHNPPIIYHAETNSCEYLSVKKNFVLGGMENFSYTQQETTLQRGDLIFTYTDGVNEAMNIDNEEYTSKRLLNFMNATDCRADLQTLLAAVKAELAKHIGAAEQSDDITMLAVRLLSQKN